MIPKTTLLIHSQSTKTASNDILQEVKKILSKEPIAAASTIDKPTKKTKLFNPGLDIPKKPSKVVKDKAKALLEIV